MVPAIAREVKNQLPRIMQLWLVSQHGLAWKMCLSCWTEASTVPFLVLTFSSLFFSPGFIYLPGIFTSPLPTVDFYFHECSADPSWVDWTVHRAGHIAGFIFCEISGLFTTNNILWDRDCLFYPLPSVISIPLPFSSFYSVVNCKTKLQKTACTYSKLGWMEDLEDGRCNRTKRRKDEQLGHSHTAKCWQREE